MAFQLTSGVLEHLHENIIRGLNQNSILDDLNPSTGAVPYATKIVYPSLSHYGKITIIGRISGLVPSSVTPSYPHKYEKFVEVGKIQIKDEVAGVEVVQRFEDCRGCISTQGCDRFEVGSILFKTAMFTGYTEQDVACKKSIDLPSGNCTFKLQRHSLSDSILAVNDSLYEFDAIPMQNRLHKDMRTHAGSYDIFARASGVSPDAFYKRQDKLFMQEMAIFPILEKITTASTCARLIMDAYSNAYA